jgi:hypothetical protein
MIENISQNAAGQAEPAGKTRPARLLDIRCWRATIYPSAGLIWNGWLKRWWTRKEAEDLGAEIDRVIDNENVLVKEPEDFRAGIMWDAWLHVKECGICQQLNGVTQEEARATVKEIREEWEAYMGVNPEVE